MVEISYNPNLELKKRTIPFVSIISLTASPRSQILLTRAEGMLGKSNLCRIGRDSFDHGTEFLTVDGTWSGKTALAWETWDPHHMTRVWMVLRQLMPEWRFYLWSLQEVEGKSEWVKGDGGDQGEVSDD